MLNDLVLLRKKLCNKKNVALFSVTFLFGLAVFLLIITNNLNNKLDSLWVGPYFYANENEYECGRWLWPIIDKFFQGFNGEPFVTLFSLLLFSLGNVILIDGLNIKNNFSRYFTSLFLISSTSICVMLTFKHQSYMFALSYVFSVMSPYLIIRLKNSIISITASSILLILTLASYQSEIGCFCLMILLFLVVEIKNNNYDECKTTLYRTIVTVIISCLLYKVVWDLILKNKGLSITGYKEANSISIFSIIACLPKNILKTYVYYYNYLFGSFRINTYPFIILLSIVLIGFFLFLYLFTNSQNIVNLVLTLMMILLTPIAVNFSCLFLDAGVAPQQTFPETLLIPLLLSVLFDFIRCERTRIAFAGYVLVALTMLFGSLLATFNDIEAMREGKTASIALIENIVNTMIDNDIYEKEGKYYFIGEPCDNELFYVTELWDIANDYSKIGKFDNDVFGSPASYQGILNYYMGLNIQCNYSSNNKYLEFLNNEEVLKMPCYPNTDSIKKIEDYIVIKVSDIK